MWGRQQHCAHTVSSIEDTVRYALQCIDFPVTQKVKVKR